MAQTIPTQTGTTRALLIGVDDYSIFDDCSDLKGSRNDVLVLASYCVQVLGIPAGNIHVLTSPKLKVEHLVARDSIPGLKELTAENMGEATEQEVKKGLGWLLDRAHHGGALLAFSGHGAWSKDQGPLLCLTDAVPGFSHGVLSLRDLGHDIKKAGAKDRLIALFDCCHVAAPTNHHRRMHAKALPHGGTADDVKGDDDLFNVSNRVLLGAKPGKEAYQALLGGKWSGGLTFALVAAAERWQGESEMSHGSYKHVMRRTKGTLNALGVPQHPAFRAPEELWGAIRKQPFLGVKPGTTVRKPDAAISGLQLTPDFHTIRVGQFVLTQIVASGNVTVYVSLNGTVTPLSRTVTERWYVNDALLGTGPGQLGDPNLKEITIDSLPIPTNNSAKDPLQLDSRVTDEGGCPEGLTWLNNLTPPRGTSTTSVTNYVFKGAPTAPAATPAATLYVLFSVTATTTGGTTTRVLTQVQWYLTGLTAQPNGTIGVLQPGSSTPTAYSIQAASWSPPTTSYWAASSVPAAS